jgi:hypothetical protein
VLIIVKTPNVVKFEMTVAKQQAEDQCYKFYNNRLKPVATSFMNKPYIKLRPKFKNAKQINF